MIDANKPNRYLHDCSLIEMLICILMLIVCCLSQAVNLVKWFFLREYLQIHLTGNTMDVNIGSSGYLKESVGIFYLRCVFCGTDVGLMLLLCRCVTWCDIIYNIMLCNYQFCSVYVRPTLQLLTQTLHIISCDCHQI